MTLLEWWGWFQLVGGAWLIEHWWRQLAPLYAEPVTTYEPDDIQTEGLGLPPPRVIGTRTSPVANLALWTPAERQLWTEVLEAVQRERQ